LGRLRRRTMKIKVLLSNSGEFMDIEFEDAPKYIDMEVELIHYEEE